MSLAREVLFEALQSSNGVFVFVNEVYDQVVCTSNYTKSFDHYMELKITSSYKLQNTLHVLI